jgi:putative transposase
VIDSQLVKTTRAGGLERGYDGAKRLAGRKRHLFVDTNGLVLTVRVHGADLHAVVTAGGNCWRGGLET